MTLPMVARLHVVRRDNRRDLRLWLPLFLLWLLALPFAIVALPVVALILWTLGRRPFAVFAAYWGVLSAMRGTRLEIDRRHATVFMHVY